MALPRVSAIMIKMKDNRAPSQNFEEASKTSIFIYQDGKIY
jgi:hypothetical protein